MVGAGTGCREIINRITGSSSIPSTCCGTGGEGGGGHVLLHTTLCGCSMSPFSQFLGADAGVTTGPIFWNRGRILGLFMARADG